MQEPGRRLLHPVNMQADSGSMALLFFWEASLASREEENFLIHDYFVSQRSPTIQTCQTSGVCFWRSSGSERSRGCSASRFNYVFYYSYHGSCQRCMGEKFPHGRLAHFPIVCIDIDGFVDLTMRSKTLFGYIKSRSTPIYIQGGGGSLTTHARATPCPLDLLRVALQLLIANTEVRGSPISHLA